MNVMVEDQSKGMKTLSWHCGPVYSQRRPLSTVSIKLLFTISNDLSYICQSHQIPCLDAIGIVSSKTTGFIIYVLTGTITPDPRIFPTS